VQVRLRVHDEPVAAVCAHLASGEAPGDDLRRVSDFLTVTQNGRFGGGAAAAAAAAMGSSVADQRYRCLTVLLHVPLHL
jgi:hypothetical protein